MAMTFLQAPGTIQFVKFCMVGLLNFVINYSIFLALFRIAGIPYTYAAVIGFFSGAVSGYFLNKSWTFRAHDLGLVRGLMMYLVVQLVSLTGHLATLKFCAEVLYITPELSNLGGISVSTIINFWLSKVFVFRKRSTGSNGGN